MQTITTIIKREWLQEIIAGRKKIEYREIKPYWEDKLSGLSCPFLLRIINGMSPNAPEATLEITKVLKRNGEFELHIGKIVDIKNWDVANERPIAEKKIQKQLLTEQVKILFFDIETAGPASMTADLAIVICFGFKWGHESRSHCLTIDEKSLRKFDDSKLLKEACEIFNQADLIVAHYGCVVPSERILTADLRWVEAGTLKVGDKLWGFDSEPPEKRGNRRKFRSSTVTFAEPIKKPVVRLNFDDGTNFECSADHPLLIKYRNVQCRSGKYSRYQWIEAGKLKAGDTLQQILPIWETDTSYEAGYLAGVIDGEGHLNSSGKGFRVAFGQNENELLKQSVSYLEKLGFESYESDNSKNNDVVRCAINGGKSATLRLLGTVRPVRLLANLVPEMAGGLHPTKERPVAKKITEVVDLGDQTVIGLSTTTETYLAGGFASHNSVFDRRFIQGRLLINNLPPIPQTKMRDTCFMARSIANFSRNRLGYLCKILDLGHEKLDNDWPHAWFKVLAGDMNALRKMAIYCKGDVLALEDLYNRLKAFDNPHPRIVSDRTKCGLCGGEIEYRGFSFVGTLRYRRFVCKNSECRKWDRERTAIKASK